MKKLSPIKIADGVFEVDLRGWMCPLPRYVLDSLLPKIRPGWQVDLLVDCPGAITDIPVDAAAANLGSEVEQIANGEWRIVLQA